MVVACDSASYIDVATHIELVLTSSRRTTIYSAPFTFFKIISRGEMHANSRPVFWIRVRAATTPGLPSGRENIGKIAIWHTSPLASHRNTEGHREHGTKHGNTARNYIILMLCTIRIGGWLGMRQNLDQSIDCAMIPACYCWRRSHGWSPTWHSFDRYSTSQTRINSKQPKSCKRFRGSGTAAQGIVHICTHKQTVYRYIGGNEYNTYVVHATNYD